MPLSTASSPERLLRGAFALLAVVLLLVAVWVSMARALLPLLNEYRPELESALRTHLGQDVRIGQITGSWVGLSAQLVARDIEIRNGDHLIYLENLNIIPALWSSLRRGSLQLSRVAVEGLQLGMRQQADGQWQLKGLGENNAHSAPAPFDPASVLRLFTSLQEVLLIDARLTVEPWQRPAFTFNDIDAQLNTTAETLQLHSRWRLPDGQSAALRVDMEGRADAWPDVRAQVYAELPNADWVPWLPSLRLPQGGEITRLSTGGQLWLTWAAGSVQRVVTHVTAPAIDVRGVQQSAAFSDVQGTLWWSRTAEAGWQLQTSALDGQFAGRPLGLGALQVEYTRPDAPWTLHLSSLDLTPLSQMVMQLAPLPPLAHEIVATLAPQGVLESAQVQVHVQPEQALPEVRYRVQLKQVGTQAWGDVPAFANISGELSGSLHGGELRLDTQQFMLSLPRLFPEAWHYRTAQARLQWQWDERAFTLSSRLMRLSGDEGELAGNMLIRLFHDPAAESYMDLQVGLRQGSALYTPRYLPTRLAGFSPSLANWLQQAIRGGQVEQGMFIYQGALSAQRPETARALALYFNVNEVALDYQAEWPPLSQVRGEVFVEDDRVRVVAPSGRAWNSQLENVDVQLDRRRTPMKLQVTGSIRSDVVDGLRILQDTPLGREKTFSTWKGEGVLRGDLQLDIPLEGKEEVRARVGFATENARLQLTNPALDLQAIQGRFLYDTERGLSSNDVQAQLWGQSVRGRLQASGRPGKPRSQLTAEGLTEVARLAKWLGAPDPLPVSGRLPYRLALDVQGDERWLTVKSSLQGVAVDLPAPLGKLANEVRDSQWQMNFTGREQVYRFTQPGLMSVDMALPMGARMERARAELRFGSQAASAPSEPGWRLLGDLAQVDIGAWRAALDKWTSKSNGSGLGALRSINLKAKTATLGDLTFSPLSVALDTQADWQLLLDSPELKGQLAMPNQTGAPWRLHVQRLQLPARNLTPLPPGTPPSPDPLASVNPRALPALDAQIDNLWQGADRLGRWQFQARPTATGVAFTHLNLEMRGLHINGQLEWQGAAGATRTHYQGTLYGQDANEVLLAWGFAPSLSSEHFRVSVDGGWPGSPAQAGLRQFSGSVDIRARNGQVIAVESGALRVFGIFNFDALRRRLRFDFSDLFGKGLAYDRIDGRLQGTDGIFLTDKPFTLEGPSTRLALEGQLDAVNEQMASRLNVSLPLSNNLPVAALLAGALPIAGALLIVDRLMGDQISKVASVEYRVDGPWQNPQISPFGKPSVPSDNGEASE